MKAAEIKKDTALLRGVITGRVVTLDQMVIAKAGYGVASTPRPALPLVVRTLKDNLEHRVGVAVTESSYRVCGEKILCDFSGHVAYASSGGERYKGAVVQGTIDLTPTPLATCQCQGRLELLRPAMAEVA